MNNKIITGLAFLAGVAIGAFTGWQVLKNKYAEYAQEEINSVKEAFAKKEEKLDEVKAKAEKAEEKPNVLELAKTIEKSIKKNPYTSYVDKVKHEEVEDETVDPKVSDKPYVIPPEEISNVDGYETVSLIYFADKVLTDEEYDIIDDPNDCIGTDSLNHFGEYEDDSVCVRNDVRHIDYEILRDNRSYFKDIRRNRKPHEITEGE